MNIAKTFIALALVTSSFAIAACGGNNSQATGPVFGQAEAQTVRDRSQALAAAVNSADPQQIIAFFHGDSVLLPAEQPTVRGRDAIQAFYENLLAGGQVNVELETSDVGGHGPIAYETGTYTLTRAAEDGSSTRDRGKFVSVWRDRNGQWMIDYTIWASDMPEPVQIASAR
ncbi:MAG: DUF4440 domain-containing protein [Vicinamibacterales bacterium]